jgi:hypothetical protein
VIVGEYYKYNWDDAATGCYQLVVLLLLLAIEEILLVVVVLSAYDYNSTSSTICDLLTCDLVLVV